MSILFLLVVLPLTALTLIFLGAIWLANMLADRMVGNKHRVLEEIVNRGEIPQQWTHDLMSRLLPRRSGQQQRQAHLHRRALHKLDELLYYVQTTSLVADEETREVLVERLTAVRAQWQSRSPEHR